MNPWAGNGSGTPSDKSQSCKGKLHNNWCIIEQQENKMYKEPVLVRSRSRVWETCERGKRNATRQACIRLAHLFERNVPFTCSDYVKKEKCKCFANTNYVLNKSNQRKRKSDTTRQDRDMANKTISTRRHGRRVAPSKISEEQTLACQVT